MAVRGDYYPLTREFGQSALWSAYQFHLEGVPSEADDVGAAARHTVPGGQEGFALYFRNANCTGESSMPSGLQGLHVSGSRAGNGRSDAEAESSMYRVVLMTNSYLPDAAPQEMTGDALAALTITIPSVSGSVLLKYKLITG